MGEQKHDGWRRKSRQGQISVEYVMILAFVFAVLVPGIFFLYAYNRSSGTSIAAAQFDKLGQEMMVTAFQAAAQGKGSWLTLDANIPDSVVDIIVNETEITITFWGAAGESQVVFFGNDNVQLSNTIAAPQAGSVFRYAPHSGKASFRFTNQGGYIAITETG